MSESILLLNSQTQQAEAPTNPQDPSGAIGRIEYSTNPFVKSWGRDEWEYNWDRLFVIQDTNYRNYSDSIFPNLWYAGYDLDGDKNAIPDKIYIKYSERLGISSQELNLFDLDENQYFGQIDQTEYFFWDTFNAKYDSDTNDGRYQTLTINKYSWWEDFGSLEFEDTDNITGFDKLNGKEIDNISLDPELTLRQIWDSYVAVTEPNQ